MLVATGLWEQEVTGTRAWARQASGGTRLRNREELVCWCALELAKVPDGVGSNWSQKVLSLAEQLLTESWNGES